MCDGSIPYNNNNYSINGETYKNYESTNLYLNGFDFNTKILIKKMCIRNKPST